jgi:hypothetical protein
MLGRWQPYADAALAVEGGEEMRELTQEEILEIVCAPAITDEPEESDFFTCIDDDGIGEENFVKNLIAKELD